MGLTVRARKVQQIFEALLVGCIIVILIFLVMRASLRSETVPKVKVTFLYNFK